MEIALKIAKKIKANERFSAYIVIPMWPEGDPKSLAMQRILRWQVNLIQSSLSHVVNYSRTWQMESDFIMSVQSDIQFFIPLFSC